MASIPPPPTRELSTSTAARCGFDSPADARRQGIAYVPQEIEVLEQLSVAENVFAGQTSLGEGIVVNRRARIDARKRSSTTSACDGSGARLAHLTAAQRHLVMIARALSTRPRVLMLDEPTASLSGTEVDKLLELLTGLKRRGATILYITHRLAEVLAICDRATILRTALSRVSWRARSLRRTFLSTACRGKSRNRCIPNGPRRPDAHRYLRSKGCRCRDVSVSTARSPT